MVVKNLLIAERSYHYLNYMLYALCTVIVNANILCTYSKDSRGENLHKPALCLTCVYTIMHAGDKLTQAHK